MFRRYSLTERVSGAVSNLGRAQTALNQRRRSATGHGEKDIRALDAMHDAETPMSPKELAAALQISSASVTVLLDRLVAADLVERRPHSHDRRSLTLHLTSGAPHRWDPTPDILERLVDTTPSNDLEAVVSFLGRLSDELDHRYS